MKFCRVLMTVIAGLTLAFGARAGETVERSLLLVANPALEGFYRQTVVFVSALGNGRHFGFIVNRPTPYALTPTSKDGDPEPFAETVYLGGPVHAGSLFVLMHARETPAPRALAVGREVFLAFDSKTAELMMKGDRNAIRLFAGLVIWRPGELASELEHGLWLPIAHDPGIIFHDRSEELWVELIRRFPPFF